MLEVGVLKALQCLEGDKSFDWPPEIVRILKEHFVYLLFDDHRLFDLALIE